MSVIRRLCVEEGKGPELADKLTEKLSESLKEATSQNRVRPQLRDIYLHKLNRHEDKQ